MHVSQLIKWLIDLETAVYNYLIKFITAKVGYLAERAQASRVH